MQKYHIITIGSEKIGKTSLNLRFAEDIMYNYTGGFQFDHYTKVVKVGETDVNLRLWDYFDKYDRFQPRYPPINFYKADACIVAFDITNRESYEYIEKWMEMLSLSASDNLIRALVGCKSDLVDNR